MKPWQRPATLVFLTLSILPSVHLAAPPRFDETGYAVLARSLAEGRGYREIDKPQAPRHAHFPPGWPVALAAVWSAVPTGVTTQTQSAHLLTVALWLAALALWYRWYRQACPETAGALFVALAANWLWIRLAGELRSESLFLALSAGVIVLGSTARPKSCTWLDLALGLLAGACILTRQVGVALAGAVVLDRLRRRDFRSAAIVTLTLISCITPWLAWQRATGAANQAQLLVNDELARSLGQRLADQALFYTRRLPDSLFGPYVESATVFSNNQALALAFTASAAGFTLILLTGIRQLWLAPATRLAAMYWSLTMAILLVWPFTEAGRFLIPLVPIGLLGLLAGSQNVLDQFVPKLSNKNRVAWLLAGLAVPFGSYTWLKDVRTQATQADQNFDRTCAWISQNIPDKEFIAARHPGDLYWRTGRQADFWPKVNSVEEAAADLQRRSIGYLLIDQGRFVGDTLPDWLKAEHLRKHPDLFQLIDTQGDKEPGNALWRVVKAPAP